MSEVEVPTLFDTSLAKLQIAVFDLETTGLFPAKDHIIQIAVVPVSNGRIGPRNLFFEAKVNPGPDVVIPPLVLELTKLEEAEIRAAPPIKTQLPVFDRYVGKRVVAGHNVGRFDLPFIRRAESRVGIDVQTDYYVDTLQLARRLRPKQKRHNLAACAQAYGIEFNPDSLHDALADTVLCAELLLRQFVDLDSQGVVTFGEMISYLSSAPAAPINLT